MLFKIFEVLCLFSLLTMSHVEVPLSDSSVLKEPGIKWDWEMEFLGHGLNVKESLTETISIKNSVKGSWGLRRIKMSEEGNYDSKFFNKVENSISRRNIIEEFELDSVLEEIS